MPSIELYVHERTDETRVVSNVPLTGRTVPREWGALELVGVCTVEADVLSDWVRIRLRDEGFSAVIGRDARTIERALCEQREAQPQVIAPQPPIERVEPIWMG